MPQPGTSTTGRTSGLDLGRGACGTPRRRQLCFRPVLEDCSVPGQQGLSSYFTIPAALRGNQLGALEWRRARVVVISQGQVEGLLASKHFSPQDRGLLNPVLL